MAVAAPSTRPAADIGHVLLRMALDAAHGDRAGALEALTAAIERLRDEGTVRRGPRAVPMPATGRAIRSSPPPGRAVGVRGTDAASYADKSDPARNGQFRRRWAEPGAGLAALARANLASLYDYRLPATGKPLGDANRDEVAEASRLLHAAYKQARVNSKWFGLIASTLPSGVTVRQKLTVEQLQQLQYRARADE